MLIEHERSIRLIRHVDYFADFFYPSDHGNRPMVVNTHENSKITFGENLKSRLPIHLNDDLREVRKDRCIDSNQSSAQTKPSLSKKDSKRREKRLRVQFDFKSNQIYLVSALLADEKKERWFTPKELQRFRVETINQRGKSSRATTDASYFSVPSSLRIYSNNKSAETSQSSLAASFQVIVKGLYDEEQNRRNRNNINNLSRNPTMPQSSWVDLIRTKTSPSGNDAMQSNTLEYSEWEEAYVELVSQHPELAGMERYALEAATSLTKQNSFTRKTSVRGQQPHPKQHRRRQQLVLLQELQCRNSIKGKIIPTPNGRCGGDDKNPNTAEFIRHACESVSLPSRNFAQRIATLRFSRLKF